jgi:diazepam-binding inhibitor (GABA receptor modulating acyl-CoA-binding protein)
MITLNLSITMIKLLPPKVFKCENPIFVRERDNLQETELLFKKAVAESDAIDVKGKKNFLRLYSLYKQATEGDIEINLAGAEFNYAEKEKLDAWASLKGMSVKDAKRMYIMLVYELKN